VQIKFTYFSKIMLRSQNGGRWAQSHDKQHFGHLQSRPRRNPLLRITKSVGWFAGGAIAKPPAAVIATRVSNDANKSVRQNSGPRPQRMAGSASLGAIPQHRGGLLFKASSACQGLGAKLILRSFRREIFPMPNFPSSQTKVAPISKANLQAAIQAARARVPTRPLTLHMKVDKLRQMRVCRSNSATSSDIISDLYDAVRELQIWVDPLILLLPDV
jgi:hypothetical protein